MKKTIIIGFTFFLLMSLTVITGCIKNQGTVVIIDKDGTFPTQYCEEQGFKGQIIMLESKNCPACQQTLPIFIEAASETGTEPLILDLAEPSQLKQMQDMNINIQYTPTFIFGCEYFVGAKDKADYVSLMEKVKNS